MTNTASKLRADPFGIDIGDDHGAFDANTYDVSE
jgi:hypothetical protein